MICPICGERALFTSTVRLRPRQPDAQTSTTYYHERVNHTVGVADAGPGIVVVGAI